MILDPSEFRILRRKRHEAHINDVCTKIDNCLNDGKTKFFVGFVNASSLDNDLDAIASIYRDKGWKVSIHIPSRFSLDKFFMHKEDSRYFLFETIDD